MVKEIRIYIEGDSKQKGKGGNISLREGFHEFFKSIREKAKNKHIEFKPVLAGSKSETFEDFIKGVATHRDSFVAFLVDSDEDVRENETAKSFLQKQNQNWHLNEIDEERCHLMVQVMESWFIADVETLQNYYGQNFHPNAIPKHVNCEKISKPDIEDGLDRATRDTTKGTYHKIKHGAELLRRIDVRKVKEKAEYCKRLFDTLEAQIDSIA